MNRCARLAIPPNKSHPTHNPTPWWNKNCAKAIKERNRAKRKYSRTADPIDLVNYKKLKAVAVTMYVSLVTKLMWAESP